MSAANTTGQRRRERFIRHSVGLLLAASCAVSLRAAAQGTAATVAGVVIDSLRSLEPVAGANVALVGSGRTTVADRLGRFAFRDVPPGTYTLSYWAPWLDSVGLPAIRREVRVEGGSPAATSLTVPALAVVQTAICGGPLANEESVVLGEVRDPDGAPVAGAALTILWIETRLGKGTLEQSERALGTVTSASGWYTVCGVPSSGARTLRVSRAQAADTVEVVVSLQDAIQRRDVMVGTSDASATVRGRVVTGDRPVVGASVSIVGRALPVYTSAEGTFTLVVPRQSIQLLVRAVGFVPLQIDVEPATMEVDAGDIRVQRLPPLLARLLITGRAVSQEEFEFEERRRQGMGSFVDEATLGRAPVVTPNFVVSQVPMARSENGGFNGRRKIMLWRGAGPCDPRFFVDGWDLGPLDVLDQEMYLRHAKRIEVYRAAFAPAQFNDFAGCGSVVVWTR